MEFPERALFIRPDADIPSEIDDLTCEQGFKPTADRLEARGFTVTPAATGSFPTVFVSLTRNRTENMANVARALRLGDQVIVSGNKTDGIDSLLKAVKKVCDVDGVLSKSHGKVFWITPSTIPDWTADPKINEAGFITAPGMFSPDKIDKGSTLLTEYFDDSIKGEVADLGAGWGYLSAKLLEKNQRITALDAYEAEHIALNAAKANLTDPRANFYWSDVTTMPKPDSLYHTVITNPPFHQSRAAEPALGVSFIATAARILKPSGQMLLVANRQLPYETALDLHFKHWEILFQNKAFKIIRARRPKSTRG